ncbi:hypothetical protein [Prosthecobacter debontii]|nr:hypothetical protein [Prosthecobacter debontii]
MKRSRPDIVAEFRDKAALLQKKNPLPGAAKGGVEQIITDGLAA